MEKLLKIDSVMYRVADLDSAEKFYSDKLGLKRVWKDEVTKMIGFKFAEGDSEIVLHQDANLPSFDYSFLANNVDQFVTEWIASGNKVCFGPIEVRTGKYAVLGDPDGNKIPIIDLTKFGGKPKYD